MRLVNTALYRKRPIYESKLEGHFTITEALLRETMSHLRSFGAREGLAFWGGTRRGSGETELTTLLKPKVDSRRLGVLVDAEEFGRLSKRAIRSGICVLAQIHSHPTDCTIHSDGDDDLVVTIFDGMLSLVVPNYGIGVELFEGITVHQRQNGRWIVADTNSVANQFEIKGGINV